MVNCQSTECQAKDPPTFAPSFVPSNTPTSPPVDLPSYWLRDDDDGLAEDIPWRETTFSQASRPQFDVTNLVTMAMIEITAVGIWGVFYQ